MQSIVECYRIAIRHLIATECDDEHPVVGGIHQAFGYRRVKGVLVVDNNKEVRLGKHRLNGGHFNGSNPRTSPNNCDCH